MGKYASNRFETLTLAEREAQSVIDEAMIDPHQAQFEDAMTRILQAPKALVPLTFVAKRRDHFLRLCECGHAGRSNFHNGDEGEAFKSIGAADWVCGFCTIGKENPGKDDAELKAAQTTQVAS